jgi:hypothetical protein
VTEPVLVDGGVGLTPDALLASLRGVMLGRAWSCAAGTGRPVSHTCCNSSMPRCASRCHDGYAHR